MVKFVPYQLGLNLYPITVESILDIKHKFSQLTLINIFARAVFHERVIS